MGSRFTSWVAAVAFISTLLSPGVAHAEPFAGDMWVSQTAVLAQGEAPPAVGDSGIDGVAGVQSIPEIENPAPHVDDFDTRPVPSVREYVPEVTQDLPNVSDLDGESDERLNGDTSGDEALGSPVESNESILEKVEKNVKPENEKYLTALDTFAAHIDGAGYNWGGPKAPGQGGDCSGFMGQLLAVALGEDPWVRMGFSTANQGEFAKSKGMEILPGGSPLKPGEFSFGWYNGGSGGGHTSGTLPSMVNVESGGQSENGVSINKYGRNAAPSNDSQFHEGMAVLPWSFFEENKDRLNFGMISWEEADWRCTGSGAVDSAGVPRGDLPEEASKGNC